MGFFVALAVLVAAFLDSAAASSAKFSSAHVTDLAKNFDEKVGDGKVYFIKFYAPWCGHCKSLAPAWDELGQSFENDSTVVVAHVDCTHAEKVCDTAQVDGYPTLKIFFNGEEQEEYEGGRDLASLQQYVSSQKATLLQETKA